MRSTRAVVAPLVLAAALLAAWWLATPPGGTLLYPAPETVAGRLVRELTSPVFWGYVATTFAEAVGGSLLGAAVALPLAALIHRYRWLDAALAPFLGATQAIPAIAIAPLLVLWVDYGLTAIVVLCALMVFFPILVATVTGLRHLDGAVADAARIDGAGPWQALLHVEAPMALPHVLAGLRNGFTLSVTGAVVGEMVMGGHGMGALLAIERQAVDTPGMVVTILVLCALASAAYVLIRQWERRSRIVNALQSRS